MDLLSQVFGRTPVEPPQETRKALSEVTDQVLETYLGKTWRRRAFKHLTFRSEVFDLTSIEGLLRCRVDLTFLESLDVSENSLTELACIAGESLRLKKEKVPQGLMFFSNLQVLKVRKNLLSNFSARLPNLRELDLGYNKLQAVPAIYLTPKLEVLLLCHNQIKGTLLELKSCEALKRIDLSNNAFDFNASTLKKEIQNMAHLPSLILKLKDNPFAATFPTYQVLTLQELPQLRKLDDISDMSTARQAASQVNLNLKKLDEFAFRNQDGKAADVFIRNMQATAAVFRAANKKTVFAEISGFIVRALQDPDSVQIAIAGLTRLTHTISQGLPEDMANLREELHQGSVKAPEKIQTLMGDFEVLAGRVAGPNQKILLLRAVAKLSVVDVEGLGEQCMKLLRKLAELNPSLEERVMQMLQEMIIYPIKNYHQEKHRRESQERVGSFLRILAHFDSPQMGAALQPISAELVEMYCKASKDPGTARLTTHSGAHQPAESKEELENRAVVQLMERWSSHTENLKQKEITSGTGIAHIVAKLSSILDAEAARQPHDTDHKVHVETMAHLGLALNLLTSNVQEVEKVFRNSSHNNKSIHHRAMQKVVIMFGLSKNKVEQNTSIKMEHITTEGEIMIAKLFDVLGAFLALHDDSRTFEQDILEGPTQLGKFITAIIKDEPITKPFLLCGALRMARSILATYQDVKEPADRLQQAEAVTKQIIAALSEMRPMMRLLTMNGAYFESLWKACTHQQHSTLEGLPKPRTLEQPLVLQIFEAIIRLVSFFSLSKVDGPLYAEVKKVVSHQREELMFQMLTVPDSKVKVAALECVGTANVADTSTSEVETLIGFLDVKGEELQSSFTYLQKIVVQLLKMLSAKSGQGAVALRTTQAKACKEGVLSILIRTARYCPTNNEVSKSRTALLQAILHFLLVAGTIQEWQHQLRTKMATVALVTALQSEDSQDLPIPDISIERTWSGRSVEALLMTLSGPDRLRPRGKVALRVISRIADILQGEVESPKQDERSGEVDVAPPPEYLTEMLAKAEAGLWQEDDMKRRQGEMGDVEREDCRVQQEIFTSANGLERVDLFLAFLLNERQQTECKQRETALLQSAGSFLEKAKVSATQQGEDGMSVAASDSEDDFDDTSEEPIIDMPGRDFSGQHGFGSHEDLRQNFAGKLKPVFSILFTARWYSFQNWSSIVDFGDGPGQENIIICNQGRSNSLIFQVYRRGVLYQACVPAILKFNEECTYLCTVSEEGNMCIYGNGALLGSCRNLPVGDVATVRKYMYVGKSCWPDREPFHGQIKELKIWSGHVVDWEDVVQDFGNEEDTGVFDRKLIMKELFTLPSAPPKAPTVYGAINLLAPRLSVEETANRNGELDEGFIVAAALRCAYALLQAPSSPKAEFEMVNCLLDSTLVCRLLTRVRNCGPFNCACGLKILQLMGAVLDRRRDTPGVDMLVTCDLIMGYACEVVGEAVLALQEESSRNYELGRHLCVQIAEVCSVICTTLPYLKFPEDDKQGQKKFLECCYDRLVPSSLIPSLVRMALYADETPSSRKMVENTRTILVKLMERCPMRKRDTFETLCSLLLSGTVNNGVVWMNELHEAIKMSADELKKQEMAEAKAYGAQKLKFEDGQPERALGTYNVEVLMNGIRLEVSDPKHHTPCLNLVVTNKAIYVVDPTVAGYPTENTGKIQDCEWLKADLIRITRGFLPQVMFLGFKSNAPPEEGDKGETIVPIIFHRHNARESALSKLSDLKQLPIDDDKMTEEALLRAMGSEFIAATHAPAEPSLLDTVLLRHGALKLYTLSEAAVHDFHVDYSKWRPQIAELENGQDPSKPLQTDVKMLRDITDRETTKELWDEAKQGLLTRAGEVRPLAQLDDVAFFPDTRPRVAMSFKDLEGINITFYDEMSKENWRQSLMAKLQQEDDGKGGSQWSRTANGTKVPLTA